MLETSLPSLTALVKKPYDSFRIAIGAVIISRIFYAVLLFAHMFFVADFPTTFLPTAILDLAWIIIYIVLTLISDQVRFRDVFLPHRGDS